MPELCHLKCSCHCKVSDGTCIPSLFEVCTYENTACESVLAASVLFLSLFRAGWCLLMLPEALAQTSMFEREWQIHVQLSWWFCGFSGRLPFSNYCVSSLAAGFRFHLYSMCIPLPRNFNIGCCANEKLLRLIAHRRVRFFTFMFVSTLVLGAGGDSLNLIQALESIVIPETYECTSSVSTWYRKTVYDLRFWHDDVWRESRASLLKNGTLC